MILDKEQIKKILPHREPFLLADTATLSQDGMQAQTSFYADPEMGIFKGHFPDEPVLPGAYIIEAMAQCAGIALLAGVCPSDQKPYLSSVSRMRFIRPVRPKDTLICRASALEPGGAVQSGPDIYEFTVSAQVNALQAAKGVITITLR